ncbi:MAG: GNAT family N-acetyltransferase [Methylobacterium sp.]|nr:GNAT family N-acetyltransferase [Methylobacterium sp.]
MAGASATPASFSARLHPDLASASHLWRSLQEAGACTAYQRLEWVESLVAHLMPGSGASLLVIEVGDAASGRPLMLVPLVRLKRRGYSTIQWLDLGVCDYAAPILAPGTALSAAEAAQAWDAVRAVLPKVDLVRITRIPQDIFGLPNPLALLPAARTIPLKASGIVLEGDAETVIKRTCSASTGKDIVRRRKRVASLGQVRFVEARTPEEAGRIFDVLLRQRRERFRELGRFDLLDRPEVVAFYRDVALRSVPDGLVRVFGIEVNGEWIATAYGLEHGGAFHGILLAIAGEAWKPLAPGILIAAEIMEWSRRNGLTYLDFTIGDLPYKNSFRPISRDLMEVAEARSLRGHLVLGIERAQVGAKAALQRHPALFERLREVRQRLRRLGKTL